MKSRRIGLLAVVLLLVVGCGGTEEAPPAAGDETADGVSDAEDGDDADGELRSIRVILSTDSVGMPGQWVADILGYYEEEGLEVELVPTSGSAESVQQGIAQDFDIIEAFTDALFTGIEASGENLYPFFTHYAVEIRDWIVPADSDLQDIASLRGTTVGIREPGGGEVPMLRYLLEQEGIDPDTEVEIVAVGRELAGILSALDTGRVDSFVGTIHQTTGLEAQGYGIRSIFPEERRVSGSPVDAFAAREWNHEDRDLLVSFGRATAKGILFCMTSPEACVDVIGQEYPERAEDRDVAVATVAAFAPTFTDAEENGRLILTPISHEQWRFYLDVYSSGDDPLITNPEAIDIDTIVLDLVSEINDFDYDAVVEQAENWNG